MQHAIHDEDHLEHVLSEPPLGVVETLSRLPGDVAILGVGGKMGPTLARMVRRAADVAGSPRRVLGVSRFGTPGLEERLRFWNIDTIRCDLLDPEQVRRLPDAPLVFAMSGMKFGSTRQEALTWAMNVHVPALVCERYRHSRIAAFSTGNVYPLTPVGQGGSRETDPVGPVGEYACTALGRERIYEYFAQRHAIPTVILRLNYAVELRYGVLADVGRKVLAEEPLDLAMGHFNALWQGDANAMALRALEHAAVPPRVLNLAGPETISVRRLAETFGRLFDRTPIFRGEESPLALLSNAQEAHRLFGYPRVPLEQAVHWVAAWIRAGGRDLGKPTHYEVRDGRF